MIVLSAVFKYNSQLNSGLMFYMFLYSRFESVEVNVPLNCILYCILMTLKNAT